MKHFLVLIFIIQSLLTSNALAWRDLETGAYFTRDPAGFIDGPNMYAYVRQNPWTMFDPLGLAPVTGSDGDEESWEKIPEDTRSELESYENGPDTFKMLEDEGFDLSKSINATTGTIKLSNSEHTITTWTQGDKTFYTRDDWVKDKDGNQMESMIVEGWSDFDLLKADLGYMAFLRQGGADTIEKFIQTGAGLYVPPNIKAGADQLSRMKKPPSSTKPTKK